ncbi:hypothetical protein V5O48_008164 [Marasmius crinis-equi]|uniref:Macro domain-containing protein n=1 Tax=Marasmius crinis-equi TaxID=585013 RepID=A0ABR3FF00_9AGAR
MSTSIVRLSSIPTLAQLALKPAVKPKFPPNSGLLKKVSLLQGDITKVEVDGIVNAANKSLLGGGGVDGAIHRAAGPQLLEECETLNGASTGESKMTLGYNLPSKHVIHTVGPIYPGDDSEAHLLASCYKSSLHLALKHNLRSIAFPSVSTGIYGYPIVDATHIALNVVRTFLDENDFDRVVFVVFSDKDKDVFESLLPEYFPSNGSTPPPPYQS